MSLPVPACFSERKDKILPMTIIERVLVRESSGTVEFTLKLV